VRNPEQSQRFKQINERSVECARGKFVLCGCCRWVFAICLGGAGRRAMSNSLELALHYGCVKVGAVCWGVAWSVLGRQSKAKLSFLGSVDGHCHGGHGPRVGNHQRVKGSIVQLHSNILVGGDKAACCSRGINNVQHKMRDSAFRMIVGGDRPCTCGAPIYPSCYGFYFDYSN
jgi:hypothetical protein